MFLLAHIGVTTPEQAGQRRALKNRSDSFCFFFLGGAGEERKFILLYPGRKGASWSWSRDWGLGGHPGDSAEESECDVGDVRVSTIGDKLVMIH